LERVKSFAFDRGAAPNPPWQFFFGDFLFSEKESHEKNIAFRRNKPSIMKQKL
jgi:hypothetical protein